MGHNKNSFSSHHFPYCFSTSSKVVSRFGFGFGFGVVASLTLFILLLVFFSIPSNSPSFNPIFQGFNTFNPNTTATTSLLSWPLSFSTPIPTPHSSTSNPTSTLNFTQTRETHANRESTNYTGQSIDLEESHMGKGNPTKNVKNGSNTGRSGKESSISNSVGPKENLNSSIWESSGKEEREVNSRVELSNNMTICEKNESEGVNSYKGVCDMFDGRWVRDDTKPYYPAGSCPYIDKDFDCKLNGRPDNGFLKWKWQPHGCQIPSLNATDFLERLRGKKLVFVGDSLNRNMWESLVCILRHTIPNKKRVYEISRRRKFKKKGFYAFRFQDYNCSVDFVSSPFLVRESSYKRRNVSQETLRLDLIDRTTSMYHDADVIVFNTGHWWTHEKTSRGEDYYQEGNHVYPRLEVLEAYKRALSTWARWIDKNIDRSTTQVIFRGYSATHFRGGQWNSGGQCHKETEPIFNTTHLVNYPSKMIVLENILRGMKTPVMYLNISRLTDYRKDGHPSIYRTEYKTIGEKLAAEHTQDCSHWCLPGVPDTWNELLYTSLLKVGKGSWRS